MTSEEQRLLNIARGCVVDYGGGYKIQRELEIFRHGMETVVRALEDAVKHDPGDMQVNVLERLGKSEVTGKAVW